MLLAFDSNGNDKGSPATVWHNVDYHNDFVGSYTVEISSIVSTLPLTT